MSWAGGTCSLQKICGGAKEKKLPEAAVRKFSAANYSGVLSWVLP
jgi:hypothetical protein